MKFLSFKVNEMEKYGVLNDDEASVWDIQKLALHSHIDSPDSLLAGIKSGEVFYEKMNKLIKWGMQNGRDQYLIPLSEIQFLAPIPRPNKNIMCVGKNYQKHVIEMGSASDIPEHVMIFTKAPTAVIGHQEGIDAHESITSELDYEGELAIVIGKNGKNILKQDALDYVFGYTIVNDITARNLQLKHKQFFIGKSLDTTCPIGPWIVHRYAVGNPNHLKLTTKVNGEVRQNSADEQFIFPVEEVISVLSQGMTLEPGDIIATGTPSGVGKGFNPPKYLKSGDVIEIEVKGIGKLNNIVK